MPARSRRKAEPALVAALAGGSSVPKRRPPWPVPGWTSKRNKFHVAPKADRTWDGIVFASKSEMERHKELVFDWKLDKIVDLQRQVPIVLVRSQQGKPLLSWVIDWMYTENDKLVFEDFTGVLTPLKRSNMRICADLYPEAVIRLTGYEGAGLKKHIVITDCVRGRVPAKPRANAKRKKVA